MPATSLSTEDSGYETSEVPNREPNHKSEPLNDQVAHPPDAHAPLNPQPEPAKTAPAPNDNAQQMGFETTQPMMQMQPTFVQQQHANMNQNHAPQLNQHNAMSQGHAAPMTHAQHPNMNQTQHAQMNQHGMVNHGAMQMNHPAPGFQMMGFPVFQPNMNSMNEYAYVPPMRFPGKDVMLMEQMTPQAVLGRLSSHSMPQLSSFVSQHGSGMGPSTHYSQFFDYKDDAQTDLAFLEYSGGVVYDNGAYSNGGRWLTFWEYKGRIWRKAFPVSLFGSAGAKELAESFWVSKMRAIQLFNRNKQEKLIKSEKKSETRGRKKKPMTTIPDGPIPHLSLDPTLAAQYILQDQSNREKEMAKKEPLLDDMPELKLREREPRVVKTEVEGLDWDRDTSTWSFDKVENNELTTFKLPCQDKHEGLKQIQALKVEYETALLKEYSEEALQKGINYDKARMIWKVSHWVPSKGVKRNKLFSVTKLGYRQARDLALAYKEAVDELGGEEPEDNMPDPVPQEELLQDPMVNHYHKVLSSIAVRQVKDGLA